MNQQLNDLSGAIVTVFGTVGRYIKLEEKGQNKLPCLSFSVKVSKSWQDSQTGETKFKHVFYQCSLWGARGADYEKLLTEGQLVLVNGALDPYAGTNQTTGDAELRMQVKVNGEPSILGKVAAAPQQQQQPSGYGQQQGGYPQQNQQYGQQGGYQQQQQQQQQQQGGQAFNNFDIGNLDPDALGPGINLDQQ